ncbi:MAG: response regulator transcription factor [Myxococcota bacterium]
MISVVVAEDQGLILGALATLLELEEDIAIVGRATNGLEALRLVQDECPDVLVTDIEMPGLTGLELAARLRDAKTRVLIVTTFGRAGYLRRAVESGVRGYLLKDAPSEQLAEAVRRIANGERVFADALMNAAWSEDDPLNERERQVLRLAETGKTGPQIAKELGIAPGTVRNYLHEASQKLGVSSRIEAARLARSKGWL